MIPARLSPGAISESSSIHLPYSDASKRPKPVTFPPGWLSPWDDAAGDGLDHVRKDDRDRPCLPLEGCGRQGPVCHDNVGLQADQLLRERPYPNDVIAVPPKVQPHVAAIGPTQFHKRLSERGEERLHHGIVFVGPREHADAPHTLSLLRARHERP